MLSSSQRLTTNFRKLTRVLWLRPAGKQCWTVSFARISKLRVLGLCEARGPRVLLLREQMPLLHRLYWFAGPDRIRRRLRLGRTFWLLLNANWGPLLNRFNLAILLLSI